MTGTSTVTSSDAVDGPTSRTPLRNDVTAKTEPTSAAPTRQARPGTGRRPSPSEPRQAARDEERRRGAGGEEGGERHRIGVAQEPVGEQDVDGVRGGRPERHPDARPGRD